MLCGIKEDRFLNHAAVVIRYAVIGVTLCIYLFFVVGTSVVENKMKKVVLNEEIEIHVTY